MIDSNGYYVSDPNDKHEKSKNEQIGSARSALQKGEISVAEFNAAMDAILHPGQRSRAADYQLINSGEKSMLGVMADAAKESPILSDIASDIDKIIGSNLSKFFDGSKSGFSDLFSGLGSDIFGGSGSGIRGGSGSGIPRGSGSGLSVAGNSAYGSYLDMLHQEQERIWQREDTAYQRTVKDLQQAGLNPVLAVNHGISASGGSGSSDSQVVGAVADLAAMAISGLSETAKGVTSLAAANSGGLLQNFGSWYKQNSGTIKNFVSTATSLAKLLH